MNHDPNIQSCACAPFKWKDMRNAQVVIIVLPTVVVPTARIGELILSRSAKVSQSATIVRGVIKYILQTEQTCEGKTEKPKTRVLETEPCEGDRYC